MNWTVTTLSGTFDMPTSPIADYAGRLFDTKDILAEAVDYWISNAADSIESNSVCYNCGHEAVGFKSLCCNANVVTPTDYRNSLLSRPICEYGFCIGDAVDGSKYCLRHAAMLGE